MKGRPGYKASLKNQNTEEGGEPGDEAKLVPYCKLVNSTSHFVNKTPAILVFYREYLTNIFYVLNFIPVCTKKISNIPPPDNFFSYKDYPESKKEEEGKEKEEKKGEEEGEEQTSAAADGDTQDSKKTQ